MALPRCYNFLHGSSKAGALSFHSRVRWIGTFNLPQERFLCRHGLAIGCFQPALASDMLPSPSVRLRGREGPHVLSLEPVTRGGSLTSLISIALSSRGIGRPEERERNRVMVRG